ncbi:LysR family transcriptional regulator [Phytoactinopolyspora mesophila]|uniref:LysR family transcriptional regulator n=1 Tax=Phytoactinopolyspora mesophila TaxID=2650750 RepID=A0A7K3M313_9ACTN|nr:LysR family transcriptional regulator [Phytoactinopolyspora mesophila]NDL57635.1 LysR family transcriptional regulator [Phytoactinopolyspora mesophila]
MTYENELRNADQLLAGQAAPTLALLAALGETQSVTRTAEHIDIPQPTVSRRLASIAEALGAPLTQPAGRGIRLTRVGRILTEAAAQALATLEAGARQAREEVEPSSGHVVIGFLHLLGRSLVPGLLRGFRREHPSVRFSLVQGSRQQILERLDGGELDLALVAPLPAEDSALTSFPVTVQELLLSVPDDHRFAARRRIRFTELADEEFVMLEHGYGLRQITDALCSAAGFTPKIAFEGQESDTVRGLVAAGLGVSLLPRFDPGKPAGVAEVPLAPKVTRTVGLAWPRSQWSTPAVRAFREYVRNSTTLDRPPGG